MKTLTSQTPINRFPVVLLSFTLLVKGTIITWFVRHIYGLDDLSSTVAHQHSYWSVAAIIFVLVITLLIWLVTIRNLRRSQKTILANNAERTRTEKALQRSEARYRVVTESASDAILTIDREHTILFVNAAAEKIFGYTVDEMLGNKLFMLMPESMRDAHAAGMKRYKETNKRNISWQGVELPGLHKDGSEVPLEITFGEINRDSKHLFTAVIRDITTRKRAEEKIRESKEWLEAIFDASRDGIIIEDGSEIVYINKSYTKLMGYEEPEEIIGRDASELLSADDAERMAEYGRRRLRGEDAPAVYEYKGKRKDGTLVDVEAAVSTSVIGGKKYIMTAMRDITERRRTEEKLSKNERFLRTVLENITDGIVACDAEGTLSLFNKATREFHGLPQKPLAPEEWADHYNLYYADAKTPMQMKDVPLYHALQEGGVEDVEMVIKPKNGLTRTLISSGQALLDEHQQKLGAVVVMHDITGRKLAEEGLRQSEEKYRTILETIEEGYFETDLEGIFTFYNKALGNVLGYDTDELLGMHYRHYVDHNNAKKLFVSYVKVYRTGQPLSELNWEVIRKDGTRRFLESSITLIRNIAGEPTGFGGLVRDISRRKQTEDTLRESESLLAAAQRITHLGSWELDLSDLEDLNNNEVRWSDETYRIFGYEPGQIEVSNDVFYNAVHPDDRKHVSEVLIEATEQRKIYNIEHRAILPDGRIRILHGQAELIFDKHTDKPIKLLGTVQDITTRKGVEEALRDSEYKLRTLITSMSEGLTQVNNDEVIEFVNDRLCEMTGYERDELLGKVTLEIFFDDEGRKLLEAVNRQRQEGISGQYEMRLRKKSGEMLWVLIGGSPIVNAEGVMTGTLGVFTDITERKRAEEQLLHDAFHDGLTGLANRALFMDHLRMTIERSKSRHSNPYAVLFLDFDRFKMVNDSLGHAEGDQLLNQIARRLESSTRTGDLTARLGGDEFVILLSEMLAQSDAVQVAERIQNDLKKPFNLSGSEIFISASIGIALSNAGHKRAEDMVRDADIAMYRAKAKGKAQYQIFDQAMHESAARQLRLETEMRQALEREEFQLHYQPIISLETETLVGFEALVRWQHPTRGMIPPFEFIGAAEENGLILPLGNWILQESCRQLRRWQDDNPAASHLTVSVNLSCKQFLQLDLAEQIDATLCETGLDPRCLKLEITESYIMENSEMAVIIMNRLRMLGVEISLDDFGTGYSSLSYLHSLPVDYLKVDRSFVSRMTDSKENSEIVFTIIKLAQNLKMKVIAEGIETADQLAHLKRLHCEYGQGYFFSKPLEAKAAEKFIEENGGDFPFVINQGFGNKQLTTKEHEKFSTSIKSF